MFSKESVDSRFKVKSCIFPVYIVLLFIVDTLHSFSSELKGSGETFMWECLTCSTPSLLTLREKAFSIQTTKSICMLCTGAFCPTYRSAFSFSSVAGTATDYALRETNPRCNCGLAMNVMHSRTPYRQFFVYYISPTWNNVNILPTLSDIA